jgi:hypothetical protein
MSFDSRLKSAGRTLTDNHARSLGAKVELRRRLLAAVGGRVFDAFAGDGAMYRSVWRDAAGYCGCDRRWFPDERLAFVADNRRVLRSIDLSLYSIFDLDAYGAPWEQAIIIASRRKVARDERIGFAFTDGAGLNLKFGNVTPGLATLLNMRPSGQGAYPGAQRFSDEFRARAFRALADRMSCRVVNQWIARGKTGAVVVYAALVLVGAGKA